MSGSSGTSSNSCTLVVLSKEDMMDLDRSPMRYDSVRCVDIIRLMTLLAKFNVVSRDIMVRYRGIRHPIKLLMAIDEV